MTRKPLCETCGDAARRSLAQEIRATLAARGFYAPENPADLITAVGLALEDHPRNTLNKEES